MGLWLAVRMSPPPAPWCSTAIWTVGVGTMPRSTTSTPTDMSPEAAARANIGPLVRESRPSTTEGRPSPARGCAADRTQAPSAAA